MAETIKIYAVTHDMMMAYRDNYRLSKDEALRLLDDVISDLKEGHDDVQQVEQVQLEEIELDTSDMKTFMRLLNFGPEIAFRRRKILKSIDLWLSDGKDKPGASS